MKMTDDCSYIVKSYAHGKIVRSVWEKECSLGFLFVFLVCLLSCEGIRVCLIVFMFSYV